MMRETHTNCFVPIFLSLLLDGVVEYFCLSQISPVKKYAILQNRKKGALRGEERLDGKAAKRFLALPPHSLLFLTPLIFARDYLLYLHFLDDSALPPFDICHFQISQVLFYVEMGEV